MYWRLVCCRAPAQVKSGTIFDNIIITDDESEAVAHGEETWGKMKDGEKKAKEVYDEEEKKRKEEEEKRRKEGQYCRPAGVVFHFLFMTPYSSVSKIGIIPCIYGTFIHLTAVKK